MPCDSSYMEPTNREIELSKVIQLLDEVRSGRTPGSDFNNGTDRRVYGESIPAPMADDWVRELCASCQDIEDNGGLLNASLELQIWWRDHKRHDKARKDREIEDDRRAAIRARALRKLTDEEREVLEV